MAGPTAARAEVKVDFDGDDMPAQARALATIAGREAGKAFSEEFNKRMEGMNKDLKKTFDDQDKILQKNSKSISRLTGAWRRMDGTVRLAIGAIAFGSQELAAFGPALGVGITAIGGAITSLGIAGAVTIGVFSNLGGELDKLPEEVRPAAKAFQNLGDVFSDLRKELQISALSDAEGAFDSIGDTVKALTPNLKKVAAALGGIIKGFAQGIAPGTRGFETLNKLIEQAADDFTRVAKVAGTFAQALGTMFSRSDRQRTQFLEWLQEIGNRLDAFAQSTAFDVWLERGDRVFGAFGRLLDATGQALADLVDEAAVARLEDFLDTLAEAMPGISNILSTLGELDVFGLIADALVAIGEAIDPLLGPLGELFDGLNRVVGIAIDQWADDIEGLAEIIAPLVDVLADFTQDVDPEVIKAIADALLILGGVAVAGKITALATSLGKLVKNNAALIGLAIALDGLNKVLENFDKDDAGSSIENLFGSLELGGGIGVLIASLVSGIGLLGGAAIAAFGALAAGLISTFIDTITGESWLEKLFTDFDNGILIPFYSWVGDSFTNAFQNIDLWGDDFFNKGGLTTSLEGIRTAINDFFYGLGDSIALWFTDTFWPGVVTWWNDGWTNTIASLGNGWDQIVTWFEGLRTGVNTWFLETFWPGVVTWWNDGWINTIASLANGWDQIVTWWENLKTSVNTWFTGTFWPGVVEWWNSGWAGVPAKLSNGWSQIVTWWDGLRTGVNTWFTNFWAAVVQWWNNGWAGVGRSLGNGWSQISSWFTGISDGFKTWLSGFIDTVNRGLAKVKELTGGFVNLQIPKLPGMAAGGMVFGPTRALIGEAGPEAVVPLNRPLSRVDPSVRALSAIAQGLTLLPPGGAGVSPGGKSVVIEAGAIQVNGAMNPERVAIATMNRLAERII